MCVCAGMWLACVNRCGLLPRITSVYVMFFPWDCPIGLLLYVVTLAYFHHRVSNVVLSEASRADSVLTIALYPRLGFYHRFTHPPFFSDPSLQTGRNI